MKRSLHSYLTVAVVLAIMAFGVNILFYSKKLLLIFSIGLIMGFVLYRSGICFTAMFQNLFLYRDFSMTRAVLILIIVSFFGINLVQYFTSLGGGPLPGRLHSVGVHTAVGGFLFGIGMMMAGGCGVGTLQRIGEGFIHFWFVLLGITVGSVLGIYHYSWWVRNFYTHRAVFISEHLGWLNGAVLPLILLSGLYYLSVYAEKKKISRGITNGREKNKSAGGSLSFFFVKNSGRN